VRQLYAWRAWSPPLDIPGYFQTIDTSSAEWPEDLALELGDRVSEAWFSELMYEALMCEPWVGQ
jgi:hypothetical protein